MYENETKTGIAIPKANPGVTWSWVVSFLAVILKPIIPILSEKIREMLKEFVYNFYEKAEATENPWDDFLAEILLKILGFDVPKGGK